MLQAAAKNMGTDTLKTIQYTATGMIAAPGQAFDPIDMRIGVPENWPRFAVTDYTMTIDYGGSHHSVLVEFRDFVTVVEPPLNDDRSQAVIAEVKRLVPAKPIRYVVNSHHHWDHSGGLRSYVAEGAGIIWRCISPREARRRTRATMSGCWRCISRPRSF